MARLEQGTRYAMDTEDTFLFLFTHFAKHYSTAGIGCRHVVDLWVYLRAHPEMDQARIRQAMERMKLWKFYQNILKTTVVWFEGAEPDEMTDFITKWIFSNGSWGSAVNAALSRGVRDMGKSGNAVQSWVLYIWRYIFPKRIYMQERYTVLKKAPWLLPVMWCVRFADKLMSVRTLWSKHSKKLKILTREKLETRKHMMEYVGLDSDE